MCWPVLADGWSPPDDDEWPLLAFTSFGGVADRLRPQAHEPMVLWVVGPTRLDEVADRAAAVVGTRAATAYGEHVAADLAARVWQRGTRRWCRAGLSASTVRLTARHWRPTD